MPKGPKPQQAMPAQPLAIRWRAPTELRCSEYNPRSLSGP